MPEPSPRDGIIARVDKARLLLAEARDATDAKRVMDLGRAAEVYARRQRLADEAIASATAIKIDAMALMGEMLAQSPKNKGAAGGGTRAAERGPYTGPPDPAPTLAEVGVSKDESSDAQALAALRATHPVLYDRVRAGGLTVAAARAQAWPAPAPAPAAADGPLRPEDRYEDPACLALLDSLYALEGQVQAVADRLARAGGEKVLGAVQRALERLTDVAEKALARE